MKRRGNDSKTGSSICSQRSWELQRLPVTFTCFLTPLGSQRLRCEALDKHEPMIIGGLFCLLGS